MGGAKSGFYEQERMVMPDLQLRLSDSRRMEGHLALRADTVSDPSFLVYLGK